MKKVFSFFLIIYIVLMLTVCAAAEEVMNFGEWIVTYATPEESGYIISSCQSSEKNVAIPESLNNVRIEAIGDFSFMENSHITSVAFSPYIVQVGMYAFQDCTNLQSVSLNPGLTTIMPGAFSGTVQLNQINLEETSVDTIAGYVFYNSGITEIILPESCTAIEDDSFARCHSLAKVTFPASVTVIGKNAFSDSENVVICAPYGSYAIDYAIAHEIPYEYTDLTEVSFLRGDADGDGTITIMDATKIQRVLAKLEDDPNGMIALRGAAVPGAKLDIMDATRIQRRLAQFTDYYGIGEELTVQVFADGTVVLPESVTD